eukprot:1152455-Pelagomonas_calceolata.AAC.8
MFYCALPKCSVKVRDETLTLQHDREGKGARPGYPPQRGHVHIIEITYCEDARPGQQLEAAQCQRADFCENINGKAVTLLHTILLSVDGTRCFEHSIDQLKKLGLDYQRASKLRVKFLHILHTPTNF